MYIKVLFIKLRYVNSPCSQGLCWHNVRSHREKKFTVIGKLAAKQPIRLTCTLRMQDRTRIRGRGAGDWRWRPRALSDKPSPTTPAWALECPILFRFSLNLTQKFQGVSNATHSLAHSFTLVPFSVFTSSPALSRPLLFPPTILLPLSHHIPR